VKQLHLISCSNSKTQYRWKDIFHCCIFRKKSEIPYFHNVKLQSTITPVL